MAMVPLRAEVVVMLLTTADALSLPNYGRKFVCYVEDSKATGTRAGHFDR